MKTMIQVLYCSQSRMAKGALKKIISQAYPTLGAMNFVSLDMGVTPLLELSNECNSLTLGSDQKVIVAENFYFLEKKSRKIRLAKGDDAKPLLSFFMTPDPNISLFLLVYDDAIDERSPFFLSLKKGGAKMTPINQFNETQWRQLALRFFAKRETPIDSTAISELLSRTQNDYSRFLNEAQKVVIYANGQKVDEAMVKSLVSAPLEDNAFRLSNALTRGDTKKAIAIYRDLRVQSIEPISLIRLLSNQFRFLNEVAFLFHKGLPNSEIANNLFCSSARVNASLYSIRKMRRNAMNDGLEGLYETELSILTGEKDPDTAFTLFLLNFSL